MSVLQPILRLGVTCHQGTWGSIGAELLEEIDRICCLSSSLHFFLLAIQARMLGYMMSLFTVVNVALLYTS